MAVDLYKAVVIQCNRGNVNHRREIRKVNLNRDLELIDFAATRFAQPFAPAKILAFPEVFMQGWCFDPGKYDSTYERVAKDIAIQIPGEETDLLAEKAKKYATYITGTAHEVIPELGLEYAFNCFFIINPQGEVIYKRHKFTPAISVAAGRALATDGISPHDVYDRYLKVMDGKYGRKKGDILSCFFPVIETDIGKLGAVICMEGFFPESARALALQGCEVMLRSSGILEPFGGPPYDSWELQNRSAAQFNMMYVVAPSPGDMIGPHYPTKYLMGHSMIVDYNGAVICYADYAGETVTGTVINIELLRKRRADPYMNYIPMLRTEVFRKMYAKPIYPKNLYLERPPSTHMERVGGLPLEKFFNEGIFIRPG